MLRQIRNRAIAGKGVAPGESAAREVIDESNRMGGARGETFSGLSGLKAQWQGKLLDEAVQLAQEGHHLGAGEAFDRSGALPEQQAKHADDLAYAFYRRALTNQSGLDESGAIENLQTALRFPGLPRQLRSLIQSRLTVIQKGASAEVRKFDGAIAGQFEKPPSKVELRGRFLQRFGLNQAIRSRTVEGIDEVSAIGVYRWAGDTHRNEQWSRLIRVFKQGDPGLPGFFGRILAEHVRATPMCQVWTQEVDYIVPVPAAENRKAERGFDIVARTGEHLGSRLGIPIRTDFLKREDSSIRSRFVGKAELAGQYSLADRKAEEARGRTVLLLDDVMNRGHTTGVCALRLRECGCEKVVLLVLAVAESSLQSSRHMVETRS